MVIPKANIKAVYTYLLTGTYCDGEGLERAGARICSLALSFPLTTHIYFAHILTSTALEGVMVVKKDTRMPKHDAVPIANLEVMNVMKSLKSRGYVTEEFNWQYFYYYLTDDGILFLREYLHMPESVVPATMAAKAGATGERRERRERRGDGEKEERAPREDYRRQGAWRGEAKTATA